MMTKWRLRSGREVNVQPHQMGGVRLHDNMLSIGEPVIEPMEDEVGDCMGRITTSRSPAEPTYTRDERIELATAAIQCWNYWMATGQLPEKLQQPSSMHVKFEFPGGVTVQDAGLPKTTRGTYPREFDRAERDRLFAEPNVQKMLDGCMIATRELVKSFSTIIEAVLSDPECLRELHRRLDELHEAQRR